MKALVYQFANTVAALKIPYGIKSDEQVLFLSDILSTGYFGADIANVRPGDAYIYI
jgi:threonine dehydrogenase-like Zn-dependent dehydrogenase